MRKIRKQNNEGLKSSAAFRKRTLAVAISSIFYAHTFSANAEIPIPCAGGSCVKGGKANTLPKISSGGEFVYDTASKQWLGANSKITKKDIDVKTEELLIEQFSDRALFQWDSFDIAEGNKVVFSQPDSSSIAINQILDVYPSEIFGSLQANGQVYLFNRAGIIFGPKSQINVGTLLASSLEVPDFDGGGIVDKQDYAKLLENKGLLAYFEEEGLNGQMPALVNREPDYPDSLPKSFADVEGPNGADFKKGSIWIHKNAKIKTKEYGKVMLFGSEITNAGLISTPNGQAILAAAEDQLWIEPVGGDFVVNVKGGGTVTNIGEIIAERGNVDIIGMAVNQDGLVRATTSIDFNGSIELRAEDTVSKYKNANPTLPAQSTYGDKGRVSFGEKSRTVVELELNGSATAIDSQEHKRSSIDAVGAHIFFAEDSQLIAKNGRIDVFADIPSLSDDIEKASIDVSENVRFDVSGADSVLSVDSLVAEVTLTGNELADFPVQKQGALKGKTIKFDIRKVTKTTYANGDERYLLPFADVTGLMQSRTKTLSQRASDAGTLTFDAQLGNVTFANNVQLDLSAGLTTYTPGVMSTTLLVDKFGAVVPVAEANGNLVYQGVVGEIDREVKKWGVQQKWTAPWGSNAVYDAGYSTYDEAHAGEVTVVGSRSIVGLNDLALTVRQVETIVNRTEGLPGATLNVGSEFTHNRLAENEVSLGAPSISIVGEDAYLDAIEPRVNLEHLGEVSVGNGLAKGTIYLTPTFITNNKISKLNLSSNSQIIIAKNVEVTLPAHGELTTTSPSFSMMGSVVAPSGKVTFQHGRPDVSLQSGSSSEGDYYMILDGANIDVSGTWTNDLNDDAIFSTSKLALDGGDVDIRWAGDLPKTLWVSGLNAFNVSAGAWLNKDAKLTGGNGGNISFAMGSSKDEFNSQLLATTDASLSMEAFGYGNGGSLTLQMPEIQLHEGSNSTIGVVFGELPNPIDPLAPSAKPALLSIDSNFFQTNGFSSFNIINSFSDLNIGADEHFTFNQKNYAVDLTKAVALPTSSKAPTSVSFLDPFFRKPVNLTLQIKNGLSSNIPSYVLDVQKNASLNFDPEAKIILKNSTAGGVFLDGKIAADSGDITISSQGSESTASFNADDGLLWLGVNSVLDMSGGAIIDPRPLSFPSAQYLAGGDIRLEASGYIVAQGGVMDVSGVSGEAIVQGKIPNGIYNASNNTSKGLFGSDAGAIALSGAEGVIQNGTMLAAAGSSNNVGGSLSVIIDKAQRAIDTFGIPLGPKLSRRIEVSGKDTPVDLIVPISDASDSIESEIVAERFSAQNLVNGVAYLSSQKVESGQFAKLSLSSGSDATGSIDLVGGGQEGDLLSLSMPESIFFETGVINVQTNSYIDAPYLNISGGRKGDDSKATPGENRLTLSADYLSSGKVGFVDFDITRVAGVNEFVVQTSGDIRFSADLVAPGSITLDARQIYAVTNPVADFDVIPGIKALSIAPSQSTGDSEPAEMPGRIFVLSNHSAEIPDLYAAAGRFDFQANEIYINGLVRSPFGHITLNADKVVLDKQAIVSISAKDLTIPFSPILSGVDAAVFPDDVKVEIIAEIVELMPGSTIDLSGGGDLINWGFVRSASGSQDILSPSVSPNSFAIIPGQDIAPINNVAKIKNLPIGKQVTLAGGSGLAAGTYTLLPPRYALLDKAWLVTLEPSYSDLAPGVGAKLQDGTPVVSGFFSSGLSNVQDQRYSGFSLRKASEIKNYSDYQIAKASERSNLGDIAAWHPDNAGSFQISAKNKLSLMGDVIGDFKERGFGSRVSISADKLRIATERSALSSNDGFVELLDSELENMNASSFLLGGKFVSIGLDSRIVTEAEIVEVADGVSLSNPEILITATDQIGIGKAELANVSAKPTAQDIELKVSSDVALLGISNRQITKINREVSSGDDFDERTQISIDDAAKFNSVYSLVIDSTYSVDLQSAELIAKEIVLGAQKISLGETPDNISGLRLSNENMRALSSSDSLTLISGSSIDFFGDTSIYGESLALIFNANSLINKGNGNVKIGVETVLFSGDSQTSINVDKNIDFDENSNNGDKANSFAINASTVRLGSGDTGISGWNNLTVKTDLLLLDGKGLFNVADITKSDFYVDKISSMNAAKIAIVADELSISSDVEQLVDNDISGLGGIFSVDANQLFFNTDLRLASGRVSLNAQQGDLTLGENANIDLSGVSKSFYSELRTTWGGQLSLSAGDNVVISDGAKVDITGFNEQFGGEVSITAGQYTADSEGALATSGAVILKGEIVGALPSNELGASIYISANSVGDSTDENGFTSLNNKLNNSGFSHNRTFQIRQGDLRIAADALVAADNIKIAVDEGSLIVDGTLKSNTSYGGQIDLAARGNLSVGQSAKIAASGVDGHAPSVTLASYKDYVFGVDGAPIAQGILLEAGATIEAINPLNTGRVQLRALRNVNDDQSDISTSNDVNVWMLGSDDSQSAFLNVFKDLNHVNIEGIDIVKIENGLDDAPYVLNSEIDKRTVFAKDFVSAASSSDVVSVNSKVSLWDKFNLADAANVAVIPGIEFWIDGDTVLQTNNKLNFANDTHVAAGNFIVRTSGDLTIKQTIDYTMTDQDSWSYTFASTGLKSVVSWANGTGGGDLAVADTSVVVTGSGDISLYSSGNMDLQGRLATVGRDSGRDRISTLSTGEQVLGEFGGDIRINAKGMIEGNAGGPKNPFFTDGTEYLIEQIRDGRKLITTGSNAYRMAAPSVDGGSTFNVVSLGGGDIDIHSGSSISKLTAGAFTALTIENKVIDQRLGAGNVYVHSSNNIDSSLLMVGDGHGEIIAGGDIGSSFTYQEGKNDALTMFGLQGGSINARTLGDVTFGGVMNTTLSKALSYGEASEVALLSLGGNLTIDTSTLNPKDFNLSSSTNGNLIQWLPGRVLATVFQGSLNLAPGATMFLSPSSKGVLSLLADKDINIGGPNAAGVAYPAYIFMSELDPQSIPFLSEDTENFNLTSENGELFIASGIPVPLVALPAKPLNQSNSQNSSIIALSGNIDFQAGQNDQTNIVIPNELVIYAGSDILEPKVSIKHGRSDAISKIIAQGSISNVNIDIQGPGRLDVSAGKDITFVTEVSGFPGSGITSLGGSQDSRLLGLGGADISVYAGVNPEAMAWSDFVDPYLATSNLWDAFIDDMRVFVNSVSLELKDTNIKPVNALTDYGVLQRYLEIPKDKLVNFTSETFSTSEQRNKLVEGFALSLELSSAISSSNYGDRLSKIFLENTENESDDLKKLFMDSIRVFRDSDFYQTYYKNESEPNQLTKSQIIKRVTETGLDDSEYDSQMKFYDIFPDEVKRKIIERSFLLLDEKEQRQFTFNVFDSLSSNQKQELVLDGFFGQLRDAGRLSNKIGNTGYDLGFEAIESLFPKTTYLGDMKVESTYKGSLSMDLRRIYTFDGGDINVVVPGGQVNAGDPSLALASEADEIGVVSVKSGDIRSFTNNGFLVNQSRVQTLGGGNILMWSTQGDLDAGRGARTALSAPAPEITLSDKGQVVVNLGAAISGSGIRQVNVLSTGLAFDTDPNKVKPAKGIDLIAPNGSVDAGEAGIFAAGNLNVAAAQVLNAEFIQVGGVSDGVPGGGSGEVTVPTTTDDVAALAAKNVSEKVEKSAGPDENPLSWLEVDILGFGDDCERRKENCD